MQFLATDSIFIALVAGAVVAWLASMIVRDSGFGLPGDMAMGVGGALLAQLCLGWVDIGARYGFAALDRAAIGSLGGFLLLYCVGLLRPMTIAEKVEEADQAHRRSSRGH